MVRRLFIPFLFLLSGSAALAWQVLWQLDLSLTLGISSRATALTIATVMAGMTLGALWCGKKLAGDPSRNGWRLFAIFELVIALTAWLPAILAPLIESGDAAVYRSASFLAAPFTALMLALTIGPASFVIGAMLPVMGVLAKRHHSNLSRFYAASTVGAALGVLVVTFFLLPACGRFLTGVILSILQIAIAFSAFRLGKKDPELVSKPQKEGKTATRRQAELPAPRAALMIAFTTGFAIFMLEVSWFRLLRSAWLSTTDSFALMLAVFLSGLALGAFLSRFFRRIGVALPVLLALGAMAVWGATPLLERFDLWGTAAGSYGSRMAVRLLASIIVMGPVAILLGMGLPWLLDEADSPKQWAKLYGINTIGAVLGSLMAGWLFMEWLGPVKTSWLAGVVIAGVAISQVQNWRGRFELLVPCLMILGVAWWAESGIGKVRSQGPTKLLREPHRLIAHKSGPDVSTSVVKTEDGDQVLVIDGYVATREAKDGAADYLASMGRLPMLLHPNPKDALVLCFGTGQTARAVLDENAERVTVVDVNPAVFEFAGHFKSNRDILESERIRYRTMDARSWLRRNEDQYDVITLEPMAPFMAGMNGLYSVEFYELLAERTREDGFVAQWFPLFLMAPGHAGAVAAAFAEVFPNSILWLDPRSADVNGLLRQGILIGRKGDRAWDRWPGFDRTVEVKRPLNFDLVNKSVVLDVDAMASYVEGVEPVTDDNLILSYGPEGLHRQDLSRRLVTEENRRALVKAIERIRGSQEE